MDAWNWSKLVGEMLGGMSGAKALLIVGSGTAEAQEIADKHGLALACVNGGLLKPGSFIVTTDREARGGSIDG